jgi:hypothetical protein
MVCWLVKLRNPGIAQAPFENDNPFCGQFLHRTIVNQIYCFGIDYYWITYEESRENHSEFPLQSLEQDGRLN